MNQKWSLNIEDFGKIQQAKIEINQFMVFVGENNSGKSYIMYLLWGILSQGRTFFDLKKTNSQAYKKCEKWISDNLDKEELVIDENIELMFVEWFNELLKSNKKILALNIFKRNIDIGKLYISDYKRDVKIKVKLEKDAKRISSGKNNIKIPINEEVTNSEKFKMLSYICWKLLMEDLTMPLSPQSLNNRKSGEPIYLPASRTGFMLTYKTLVQNLFSMQYDLFEDSEMYNSQFVLPISHFLKDLVGLNISDKSKYIDIVNYIENEILKGELKADKSPVQNYTYSPINSKQELPLYVTSSLVTEITPIVLFLKSKIQYKLMMIEEIEAHLHPKVQRVITRALVKLINKDLPVWITTHSDTVFQQINNCIKLSKISDKDKVGQLGYEQDEILEISKINAYQFKVLDNKRTVVERLSSDEYGFAVETFNESIYDLSMETITLNEELD